MTTIDISLEGTPNDYPQSLIPILIKSLGYQIQWVSSDRADLRILGPFYRPTKPLRMIPKPLRPLYLRAKCNLMGTKINSRALTLFHTQENVRHNYIESDYSISFDLGNTNSNHIRFPYWMEMIDWSHEGIAGNLNPRYGRLMNLDRLMHPLGSAFQMRQQKIALITSHLNEPRNLLFNQLKKFLPIDGYGAYFDHNIRNHHSSSFNKYDILQSYAYNLCPENSLYPGYVTEKIPEAFYAGSIPLTWIDPNVICDFNPAAFINLMPMVHDELNGFIEFLESKSLQKDLAEQSLLIKQPSLDQLKKFLLEILRMACS